MDFIGCVLFGGLLFLIWNLWHVWRTRNQPPGPFQLPVLGSLLHIAIYGGQLPIYEYFERLSEKYGKVFRFQAGVTSQVILSDFHIMKEISTNPSDVWINRHNDEWLMERSYGKSLGLLFSGAEGDVWKESRRFVHRTLRDFGFGKQQVQDERAHEELANLFEHIERTVEPQTRILNMHHIFSISVLNLIWWMVAGERFQFDDPKLHAFLNVMEVVMKQYSLAGDVLMAFPKLRHILPRLTGYGMERRTCEPKLLQEFQDLLNVRRANEEHKEIPADLTDAFLQKQKSICPSSRKGCSAFSDENFAVIAMDLFMAGSETTSNSLEFAFLYMILYPEVQERVHTEIEAVLGLTTRVEYADLTRLPYTEATLLETMRFSTVVPFDAREVSVDAKLGQYEIPKDTMVVCNIHAIHFDAEFWGDPHAFRPERFLRNVEGTRSRRERLIPFGIGRRQCIGEVLARSTLFIYFVSFMQRYKFEAPLVDGSVNGYKAPGLGKRVGLTVAPLPYHAMLKVRT